MMDVNAYGERHIQTLLDAIQDRSVIEIAYGKPCTPPVTFQFEPYSWEKVGPYWYIHGKRHDDNIRQALLVDNIQSISFTGEKFEVPEGT